MALSLAEVDLNLLVVLDALLREQSVGRAARRLGRTQSTTSHALGRLRTLLDDPLLIRDGRRMVLTPRARTLQEPLAGLLAQLSHLLDDGGAFVPATATRAFSLLCPDLLAPLLPTLWRSLVAEAPGIRLEIRPPPAGDIGHALLSGTGDLALGALPQQPGSDLMVRGLGRLAWAVALRRGHPALSASWDLAAWSRWPHVVVSTGSPGRGVVGEAAIRAGASRHVAVTVSTFLAAPRIAAGSDLLFSAPRALLEPLVESLGLVLRPMPLPIPPTPVCAMWSQRVHADPAHVWFRERVVATMLLGLGGDG